MGVSSRSWRLGTGARMRLLRNNGAPRTTQRGSHAPTNRPQNTTMRSDHPGREVAGLRAAATRLVSARNKTNMVAMHAPRIAPSRAIVSIHPRAVPPSTIVGKYWHEVAEPRSGSYGLKQPTGQVDAFNVRRLLGLLGIACGPPSAGCGASVSCKWGHRQRQRGLSQRLEARLERRRTGVGPVPPNFCVARRVQQRRREAGAATKQTPASPPTLFASGSRFRQPTFPDRMWRRTR